MPCIPIALQLYSVRHECEKDLPGVLKAVVVAGSPLQPVCVMVEVTLIVPDADVTVT